jgi:hypothetical protein
MKKHSARRVDDAHRGTPTHTPGLIYMLALGPLLLLLGGAQRTSSDAVAEQGAVTGAALPPEGFTPIHVHHSTDGSAAAAGSSWLQRVEIEFCRVRFDHQRKLPTQLPFHPGAVARSLSCFRSCVRSLVNDDGGGHVHRAGQGERVHRARGDGAHAGATACRGGGAPEWLRFAHLGWTPGGAGDAHREVGLHCRGEYSGGGPASHLALGA